MNLNVDKLYIGLLEIVKTFSMTVKTSDWTEMVGR